MADFVDSMFSGLLTPWHGKGNVLSVGAVTAAQAIKEGGLDWRVALHPLAVSWGGAPINLEGRFAVVRHWPPDGTWDPHEDVLGIVGRQYVPVQNEDLFAFFDPVVDRDKGVFYHTGGALKGGSIVWLLAKVPADFYVPGVPDDLIEWYILLASSHDGSLAVTVKQTPVRVVCWNTYSAALAGAGTQISIPHTRNVEIMLKRAHTVFGLATKKRDYLKELTEKLVSIKVNRGFVSRFLKKMLPSDPEEEGEEASAVMQRNRERVEILLDGSERNNLPGMQGTGWALFNAYTEYLDWWKPHHQGTDVLARTWFGPHETLKQRALALILQQDKER